MPTELLLALVAIAGAVIGYFLRPLGEEYVASRRDRRIEAKERRENSRDTLISIQDTLRAVLGAAQRADQASDPKVAANEAQVVADRELRLESTVQRVPDEDARFLVRAFVSKAQEWRTAFDDPRAKSPRRISSSPRRTSSCR
jgi:hypothetical protein